MQCFDRKMCKASSKTIQTCGFFCFLVRFALHTDNRLQLHSVWGLPYGFFWLPCRSCEERAVLDQSASEVVKHDKEVTNKLQTGALLSTAFKAPHAWLTFITNRQTEPQIDCERFRLLQKDLFPVEITTAMFTLRETCCPYMGKSKSKRSQWILAPCMMSRNFLVVGNSWIKCYTRHIYNKVYKKKTELPMEQVEYFRSSKEHQMISKCNKVWGWGNTMK